LEGEEGPVLVPEWVLEEVSVEVKVLLFDAELDIVGVESPVRVRVQDELKVFIEERLVVPRPDDVAENE